MNATRSACSSSTRTPGSGAVPGVYRPGKPSSSLKRSWQNPRPCEHLNTPIATIDHGLTAVTRIEQPESDITAQALQAEVQEATDLLADLQIQVEPSRLADVESRAKKILTGLGFTDAYMGRPVSSLSGGWRMRSSLAIALLQETDILILDEPTNFLDLLGIIWLQRYLQSLADDSPDPPTLILVSHDRDFVSLCTDLLILKDKSLTYFHGDLPTYEAAQSERKVHLTRLKEAQDKQKAHIQDTIRQNMAQGRKADDQNKMRQAKSRQKKLDDRFGLQTNARGGRFKLNRDLAGYHFSAREDIDVPPDERPVLIVLPDPPDLRFPGPLVSVDALTFRYPPPAGTKTPPPATLHDVTLSISKGDRVGILGLNGAGKSTLVRLLVDQSAATSTTTTGARGTTTKGTVAHHPRLKMGYYSQHAVEALQSLARDEPGLTALGLLVRETAAQDPGGGDADLSEGDIRGLLGSLGLPGRVASDVPVARLSGGQLVRCELARILWRRPHCLVLDEVTTHLDYETVTALRGALRRWEGAVVLVSHDRWFVRGVVEGLVHDEGGEGGSDEESEGEDDGGGGGQEGFRRRVVYRLRGGQLSVLEGGTGEFERGVEKRVKKLMMG